MKEVQLEPTTRLRWGKDGKLQQLLGVRTFYKSGNVLIPSHESHMWAEVPTEGKDNEDYILKES